MFEKKLSIGSNININRQRILFLNDDFMILSEALQKKTPPLSVGEVHIWSVEALSDSNSLNNLHAFLSRDEVIRANKYRFEKDRAVYITAKFLLRSLLGHYLKINPKEIVFEYSEFGKPSYLYNEELDFNVSHSSNRIIIGFAKKQIIGVDIEKIKEDFEPLDLAKNFFSEEEIKTLESESDVYRAFYRCWTRKESFIKAVGEGLSYPLNSFAVTMDNDHRARFIKIDNDNESRKDWRLHSFVPAEGYIVAITTNGKPNKIHYFDAKDFLS